MNAATRLALMTQFTGAVRQMYYCARCRTCISHYPSALYRTRLLHPHASYSTFPTGEAIEIRAKKVVKPTEDDIHIMDNKLDTGKSFSEFPLSENLVAALNHLGFKTAFEIQEKTLPFSLNGKDIIGRAITGSGKTLAFALPIIHMLSKSKRSRDPRAIVITPTRELCKQVQESIQSLSNGIKSVALYGGAPYSQQESSLLRGVDVICATPGRLNDHLERGNFYLDQVQFLILDEADELLTPNFKDQINSFLEGCPRSKQMMLFSATLPADIRAITKRYMNDPEMVDLVSNRSPVPENIVHQAVRVSPFDKQQVVADLLISIQPRRALIFTPTKVMTMQYSSYLNKMGMSSQAMNSDLSQNQREMCLQSFRDGKTSVLVATDVAARGIDVPETDLVIQVDPPPSGVDFYIHRSGRTGRKGQAGRAILVYSETQSTRFGGVGASDFLRQMKREGVSIDKIRPPSVAEVSKIYMENALKSLKTVDKESLEIAMPYAQELLHESGSDGVESLAAALAMIANLKPRREMDRRSERPERRPRGERSHRDYHFDRKRDGYYNKRHHAKSYDGRYDNHRDHYDYPRGRRHSKSRESFDDWNTENLV